jgi:biopolymer transport protein ExbD
VASLKQSSYLLSTFKNSPMASLPTPANQQQRRGSFAQRCKKLSTNVDLTPMVDLGFLLITFFLFTTTLAQPRVMPIMMPDKGEAARPDEWKAGQTMTLILSKDHQVYYYNGQGDDPAAPPDVQVTSFRNEGGIREVIQEKIKQVKALQERQELNPANHAAFLVKADTNSTYNDFVRLMDELNINDVKIRAVVDITAEDRLLLHNVHQ